ncbi:MAG: glycosyltransferase family 4 protein [Nocardiopsaceae bacterium]|jgi:glycosyltransferase involved in cell wall biosynthesis|nr:glycosyltransferase family 4 protein [Nocardiopsaceae bacterium]
MIDSKTAVGTDEHGSALKVCVVGSGTKFVSGISYYTYFLASALKCRHEVVAILMRHLIPRRWYPGRQHVGRSVMAYDLATDMPTFDGIDWWGLPSVPRALSFLRRNQPQVLILEWWTASVLPWYLLLARQVVRRGRVLVVELHEDLDTGEARIPLVGSFARRGLRTLCQWASMLVVHSAWDRDRMSASLGISPEKFRVIPHGPYPISGATPGAASRPARPETLREPSELTVLFFGTIRPYKGLEHLIQAFEQVRRDAGLAWKLLVVGETWEGWTLPMELVERSPYRGDIELVNRYVTDEEAAGYFRRADIVALPYLRSSASGPLAIAQSCGLPVVVTAVGGLVEAAADYTGAVLVEPGRPDALAQGLLAAAELRDRTHSLPVTWEAVAQSYADIFAAVVPPAEAAAARAESQAKERA